MEACRGPQLPQGGVDGTSLNEAGDLGPLAQPTKDACVQTSGSTIGGAAAPLQTPATLLDSEVTVVPPTAAALADALGIGVATPSAVAATCLNAASAPTTAPPAAPAAAASCIDTGLLPATSAPHDLAALLATAAPATPAVNAVLSTSAPAGAILNLLHGRGGTGGGLGGVSGRLPQLRAVAVQRGQRSSGSPAASLSSLDSLSNAVIKARITNAASNSISSLDSLSHTVRARMAPATSLSSVGSSLLKATSARSAASSGGWDAIIVGHARWPVTVFNMRGAVVHQNQASIDYMGIHRGAKDSDLCETTAESTVSDLLKAEQSDLHQLFRLEPSALSHLVEAVALGQVWEGRAQLPAKGHMLIKPPQDDAAAFAAALEKRSMLSASSLGTTISTPMRINMPDATVEETALERLLSFEVRRSAGAARSQSPPSELADRLLGRSQPSVRKKLARSQTSSSLLKACTNPHAIPRRLPTSDSLSYATSIPERVMRFFAHGDFNALEGATDVLPSAQPMWHEVAAKLVHCVGPDKASVLVLSTMNVHAKVESELQAAKLLGAEHAILEQLFPRHVIEHMAASQAQQGNLEDSGGHAVVSNESAADRSDAGMTSAGHALLPVGIAAMRDLCTDLGALSTSHEQVTIMFADIVGFTSMCKLVAPGTVMAFLNELYSAFDELVARHRVYKVETAGDCYIVAGGLMKKDEDGFTSVRRDLDPLNAVTVLEFAKAMLRAASQVLNPVTHQPIQMRVGMHTGPVVSGVVGTKMPRFCLFGDTMNTAQRMESASRPCAIHVSEDTQRLLLRERWEPTGGIELKGLGVCNTFFWKPSLNTSHSSSPMSHQPVATYF